MTGLNGGGLSILAGGGGGGPGSSLVQQPTQLFSGTVSGAVEVTGYVVSMGSPSMVYDLVVYVVVFTNFQTASEQTVIWEQAFTNDLGWRSSPDLGAGFAPVSISTTEMVLPTFASATSGVMIIEGV